MPIIIVGTTTAADVPSAPTLTGVTANDSGATATWSPEADGGLPLTGYLVTVSAADGALVLERETDPDTTSAALVPLENDTEYAVSVVAVNGVGRSHPSNIILVTPAATGEPVDVPVDPTPVREPVPQPSLQAFLTEEAFEPANWVLSRQEADAS